MVVNSPGPIETGSILIVMAHGGGLRPVSWYLITTHPIGLEKKPNQHQEFGHSRVQIGTFPGNSPGDILE